MDDWKFWMGLAYFGLALVVIALWINYDRVSADQARTTRIVAARHADVIANADAQYQQCVKSIPTLTHVNHFLRGVQEVERVLIINSHANHMATPPGSDLYRTQAKNLLRLEDAIRSTHGVDFTVPTKPKCLALKQRLTKEAP